jgi:hypothetical protein
MVVAFIPYQLPVSQYFEYLVFVRIGAALVQYDGYQGFIGPGSEIDLFRFGYVTRCLTLFFPFHMAPFDDGFSIEINSALASYPPQKIFMGEPGGLAPYANQSRHDWQCVAGELLPKSNKFLQVAFCLPSSGNFIADGLFFFCAGVDFPPPYAVDDAV